jgi:hypothetical protein
VIDAQIRRIDLRARTVLVATDEGREVALHVPAGANVEVYEPATGGTMGGTLGDLREGYWVRVDFDERPGGACHCTSIVCVS